MWVPTGRYERRVQKAEVVELSYLDEPPGTKIEATIEKKVPKPWLLVWLELHCGHLCKQIAPLD